MELKPDGRPTRQKSAFLPEHPDNRRISPHIEFEALQAGARKASSHAGSELGGDVAGLICKQEVAGSIPAGSTSPG
jgi:hypothetical protein